MFGFSLKAVLSSIYASHSQLRCSIRTYNNVTRIMSTHCYADTSVSDTDKSFKIGELFEIS